MVGVELGSMKESTKGVFRLHGWRLDRAIHYYIYFTYYHLYVKVLVAAFNRTEEVLSKFDAASLTGRSLNAVYDKAAGFVFSRYHGKVLSHGDVTKLLTVEEPVDLGPDTTRRVIPYKFAKDIVLGETEHIAVMDCPCKALLEEPCQPQASCIAVGRPIVDFWLEHSQKYNARRIDREEALGIIDALRKTGHYNQAFFKVATGGRLGVICNCCSKCCGAGLANRYTREFYNKNKKAIAEAVTGSGDPLKAAGLMAPSGYRVEHDAEKCVLCGECARVCNFGAVELKDGQRLWDELACMGCDLCVEHCPQGALSLVYDDEKGGFIPLDLDLLRKKLG